MDPRHHTLSEVVARFWGPQPWGPALKPLRMVQALTSSGPAVKKLIRCTSDVSPEKLGKTLPPVSHMGPFDVRGSPLKGKWSKPGPPHVRFQLVGARVDERMNNVRNATRCQHVSQNLASTLPTTEVHKVPCQLESRLSTEVFAHVRRGPLAKKRQGQECDSGTWRPYRSVLTIQPTDFRSQMCGGGPTNVASKRTNHEHLIIFHHGLVLGVWLAHSRRKKQGRGHPEIAFSPPQGPAPCGRRW